MYSCIYIVFFVGWVGGGGGVIVAVKALESFRDLWEPGTKLEKKLDQTQIKNNIYNAFKNMLSFNNFSANENNLDENLLKNIH